MSDYVGEHDVTHSKCGKSHTVRVYEDTHGHTYSSCPTCGHSIRVILSSDPADAPGT